MSIRPGAATACRPLVESCSAGFERWSRAGLFAGGLHETLGEIRRDRCAHRLKPSPETRPVETRPVWPSLQQSEDDAHDHQPPVGPRGANPTDVPAADVQAADVQAGDVQAGEVTPVWAVDRAEPQHDPSAALSRLVDLRDQRCCGPGCSSTAGHTQSDHNVRWPQSPTTAWNLSVKSARCHRARHTGWQVTINNDGAAHWISPLGRTYDRISPWKPPPSITGPRVLPAPRAAKRLAYRENNGDDRDLLSPQQLAASISTSITGNPRDP